MRARKGETTNKTGGKWYTVSNACFIHGRRGTLGNNVLWEERDRIAAAELDISLDPYCIQAESRRRPRITETGHITLEFNTHVDIV
jgi:hypothetical protein